MSERDPREPPATADAPPKEGAVHHVAVLDTILGPATANIIMGAERKDVLPDIPSVFMLQAAVTLGESTSPAKPIEE
jgi:hypothetical protein